jgi:hypothetical protein
MKIYWASQHEPLASQVRALEAAAGEPCEILRDPRPFDSAQHIADRFAASKADDIVVVAPLSVLDRLCRLGIRPIWCEMDTVRGPRDGGEVQANGRWYAFRGLKRVARLALEFDAGPVTITRKEK